MTPGQTEAPLGPPTEAPPPDAAAAAPDATDDADGTSPPPDAPDAAGGAGGGGGGALPPGGAPPPSAAELALTPAVLAAVTATPPPTDAELTTFLTPATLTRYLRARDGSVPAAAAAVSATLGWRRSAAPATTCAACVARPSSHSFVPLGTCVAGRPVVYSSFVGVTDKSGDGNEAHLAWALEELLGAADTRSYVWVMDFAGFGRADLSPAVGRRSLALFAAHYPERLGAAIVVDAPPLFAALYRLLRPFIDPVTAAKLTMVRTAGGGAAALWARLFPPPLADRVAAEVDDSRARAAAAAAAAAAAGPAGWARRVLGGGGGGDDPSAAAAKEGVWWTRPPLPGTGVPYIGGMILEARAAAAAGEGG